MPLLFADLASLYADPSGGGLSPLTLSFRDYQLAASALKSTSKYESDRAYWLDRLGSFPLTGPLLPRRPGVSASDAPGLRTAW